MRISMGSVVRPITMSIGMIALLGLGQGVVRADEVFFSGFTAGCFGGGCTPTTGSSTFLGLSFSSSTFSGTTAGGGANVNNLGSMTLSTAPNTYEPQTFTLLVTFIDPTASQQTFTAALTGSVISENDGSVLFDFNNTPFLFFTFNNTSGSGSFFLTVNDLAINPGQTASITGQITSVQTSAIPEPASLLLLGTGLAGLAGAVRRKLKTRQAK